MNRPAQIIVASQLVILATPAFANPIALEVVRAREVPGSHVQLTYGVDGKTPATPSNTTTFGSKSTPWKAPAGTYQTNTGSGVRGVNAIQMCDCGVPVGQKLGYQITVASAYDGRTVTLTASLTTSGKYDASIAPSSSVDGGYDAGSPPDVLPWEIPDPVEVQGLDCTVECAAIGPQGTGGAPGTGGAQGTGGAPGTGGAQGTGGATTTVTTEPTVQPGGGGCSMIQGGQPTSLFLLVLGIGLAISATRKRRS